MCVCVCMYAGADDGAVDAVTERQEQVCIHVCGYVMY